MKVKTLEKYSLHEMMETFDDLHKIRNDQEILMVGQGKMLKHTGDLHSDIMKRLVWAAIEKKWLDQPQS